MELADGHIVDAHCVNPGRMEGLVQPGAKAWVSGVPPDSKRKLRYTLELLEIDGRFVEAGRKATVLFVLQRPGGRCLRPSRRLTSPRFGQAARRFVGPQRPLPSTG